MDKKEKEIECLKRALTHTDVKGDFAKNLRECLEQKKVHNTILDNEQPDFLIISENEIIGIEHCLVDVMFKVKKPNSPKRHAQSLIREHENKCIKIVDRYNQNPAIKEAELKSGKAGDFLADMLQDSFDAKDNFKYQNFIDNFRSVCLEHNDKCNNYKKKISDHKNYHGQPIILGCVVEIPYPCIDTWGYVVTDLKSKKHRQVFYGIPITEDILYIIEDMSSFGFVILCMYCSDKTKDDSKHTKVLYFNPKDVKVCKEQQNLCIYKHFEYDELPVDITAENTEDGIVFHAKSKPLS